MDIFTIFVTFVLTWWVVVFAVLPFGNAPAAKPTVGHDPSAPANPRIRQKLLWTTIISLVITVIIVCIIHFSGFSFREMVQTWSLA
jgi:predicted secreted protein